MKSERLKEKPDSTDRSPASPCYRALSQTALMAAYLIEVGWELHLNDNREKTPAIWKARREGDDLHVDSCDVSHDDVLELHQHGLLRRHRAFEVGSETVTVFQYIR